MELEVSERGTAARVHFVWSRRSPRDPRPHPPTSPRSLGSVAQRHLCSSYCRQALAGASDTRPSLHGPAPGVRGHKRLSRAEVVRWDPGEEPLRQAGTSPEEEERAHEGVTLSTLAQARSTARAGGMASGTATGFGSTSPPTHGFLVCEVGTGTTSLEDGVFPFCSPNMGFSKQQSEAFGPLSNS